MLRPLTSVAGLVLAAASAAGCASAPAPVDTSADVAVITQLADREIAAFTAGDMASIGTLFTTECLVMPPNEPAIQGREALIAWARGLNEQFTLAGRYDHSDVIVSGDVAVHQFTGQLSMTPKAGGAAMTESVKGLHVLRRQPDGSWRITHDVWNSDAAPAMPGGH